MKLFKAITISFSLLLSSVLLLLASPKTYAATESNPYNFCISYAMTSGMTTQKVLDDIMPLLEFENGQYGNSLWDIKLEQSSDKWNHFTGYYPNGQYFSTHTKEVSLTSSLANYCIAESRNVENVVIYIDYDSMTEGTTIDDICDEAFNHNRVNIKDPVWDFNDEVFTRYERLDMLYGYYSSIHNLNYTIGTGENKPFGATVVMYSSYKLDFNNTDTGQTPNDSDEENKDETPSEGGNDSSNTTPPENGSNDGDEISKEEQDADLAFKIILGVSGSVLGLAFIVSLVSIIKWVIRWLKE